MNRLDIVTQEKQLLNEDYRKSDTLINAFLQTGRLTSPLIKKAQHSTTLTPSANQIYPDLSPDT